MPRNTFGAKDLFKIMELLEALSVISLSTAQVLRAAKRICPGMIGGNVKNLEAIHRAGEQELEILTDLTVGLKRSLSVGPTIRKGKGDVAIICDGPRRDQ